MYFCSVLRHAVIALLNFTSDCRKEHVQEFVDVLLSKLMSLLQTQSHKVQEEVVSALATVADSAGDAFHRVCQRYSAGANEPLISVYSIMTLSFLY